MIYQTILNEIEVFLPLEKLTNESKDKISKEEYSTNPHDYLNKNNNFKI